MALSDVQAVFITADTVALDADGISVAAAVGDGAALVIGGALASGGSCTFNAGRVVTILSAGDDSGISFTVTGDVTVPDEGVVFSDGVYVQYTVATFTNMTAYHA